MTHHETDRGTSGDHGTEPEPVLVQADDFVGEPPAGELDPDDYVSADQQGGVSAETGTSYERSGEPESTPYDEARAEDDIEVPG